MRVKADIECPLCGKHEVGVEFHEHTSDEGTTFDGFAALETVYTEGACARSLALLDGAPMTKTEDEQFNAACSQKLAWMIEDYANGFDH